jgi:hypothetical protein
MAIALDLIPHLTDGSETDLFLLVSVLSEFLFSLVRCYLMLLPFSSAGHNKLLS